VEDEEFTAFPGGLLPLWLLLFALIFFFFFFILEVVVIAAADRNAARCCFNAECCILGETLVVSLSVTLLPTNIDGSLELIPCLVFFADSTMLVALVQCDGL
jgi:hypothetical protein